jgi:hypothetical protein
LAKAPLRPPNIDAIGGFCSQLIGGIAKKHQIRMFNLHNVILSQKPSKQGVGPSQNYLDIIGVLLAWGQHRHQRL